MIDKSIWMDIYNLAKTGAEIIKAVRSQTSGDTHLAAAEPHPQPHPHPHPQPSTPLWLGELNTLIGVLQSEGIYLAQFSEEAVRFSAPRREENMLDFAGTLTVVDMIAELLQKAAGDFCVVLPNLPRVKFLLPMLGPVGVVYVYHIHNDEFWLRAEKRGVRDALENC